MNPQRRHPAWRLAALRAWLLANPSRAHLAHITIGGPAPARKAA